MVAVAVVLQAHPAASGHSVLSGTRCRALGGLRACGICAEPCTLP